MEVTIPNLLISFGSSCAAEVSGTRDTPFQRLFEKATIEFQCTHTRGTNIRLILIDMLIPFQCISCLCIDPCIPSRYLPLTDVCLCERINISRWGGSQQTSLGVQQIVNKDSTHRTDEFPPKIHRSASNKLHDHQIDA